MSDQAKTGINELIAAGEQAISSNRFEEALAHFQKALTVKNASSSSAAESMDVEKASILFGLARSHLATSSVDQAQESVDALRRAFDAFIVLGDTDNAVAAAIHRHRFLGFSSGTTEMANIALELVPDGSLEAGYVLETLGGGLFNDYDDNQGALGRFSQAIEIARRERDQLLELRALNFSSMIQGREGNYKEAADQAVAVIELAQSLDDLDTLVRARNTSALMFIRTGDSEEAQAHASAGLQEAEILKNSGWLTNLSRHNSTLAYLRGEWDSSRKINAHTREISPDDATTLEIESMIHLQLGSPEELAAYIDQIVKQLEDTPPESEIRLGNPHTRAASNIPMLATVNGTTEMLDVAEQAARAVISSPYIPRLYQLDARIGLGLAAILRRDKKSAREQYSVLEAERGTQQGNTICFDRLLGLLSQTIGNFDDAHGHFDDALTFCRKAGYRPELAWSLCNYADMLLERNDKGSIEKANGYLEESLAISTELGMKPLMEKVLSRMDISKA